MSDNDNCGWPTAKGHGCKHPPTEDNGRCWLHADDDRDIGRPSKYNDEDAQAAIDAAKEGVSKSGCARAAGVDRATIDRWLDAHDDFRADFTRARARGERKLIRDGLTDPDTDSQMARFLLAASFQYVKAERREHTGKGGQPLEINLNEEIVDTPYSDA